MLNLADGRSCIAKALHFLNPFSYDFHSACQSQRLAAPRHASTIDSLPCSAMISPTSIDSVLQALDSHLGSLELHL